MYNNIENKVKIVTDYIDGIISYNNEKEEICEAGFEFYDEQEDYYTAEFLQILEESVKDKNITYTFMEVKKKLVYFKIKLHKVVNWTKEKF